MVEHTTTDGELKKKYKWFGNPIEETDPKQVGNIHVYPTGFKDKQDAGKPRWDLLPIEPIEEVVEVLTSGAAKYSENGWQHVDNARDRYFAALMRHIVAWRKGNRTDTESGKSHLIHAICNLIFLYYFDKQIPCTVCSCEMSKDNDPYIIQQATEILKGGNR